MRYLSSTNQDLELDLVFGDSHFLTYDDGRQNLIFRIFGRWFDWELGVHREIKLLTPIAQKACFPKDHGLTRK